MIIHVLTPTRKLAHPDHAYSGSRRRECGRRASRRRSRDPRWKDPMRARFPSVCGTTFRAPSAQLGRSRRSSASSRMGGRAQRGRRARPQRWARSRTPVCCAPSRPEGALPRVRCARDAASEPRTGHERVVIVSLAAAPREELENPVSAAEVPTEEVMALMMLSESFRPVRQGCIWTR